VADRIADPLGADFQIGARESEVSRIAPVVPPPAPDVDPRTVDLESVSVKTFTGLKASATAANSPEWRVADLGALNGHSDARGVLKVLRVLSLGGEAGGVRLLSRRRWRRCSTSRPTASTSASGHCSAGGMGFCLGSPTVPYLLDGRPFYWCGWGGSLVVCDLDRRLTISYMMNKMGDGLIGCAAQRGLRPGRLRRAG
jgi:CubicO group peptidase (beta-lactamase class C family)